MTGLDRQALIGRAVALSAPDGQEFRFRVAALIPYAGKEYALLEHEGGEGQAVMHIETDAEQAPVFVLATEEDIISAVTEKYLRQAVARSLAGSPEADVEK
jgi:hypothetical protein